MILANVISLLLWRYCTISFLSKSLWLQITAEVSKITKSVWSDLTFIFIELSETSKSFVKIRLVVEINSIASFIKNTFLLRTGLIKCANMQKRSVQGLIIGNCCFYTKFVVFIIEICGTIFKRYLGWEPRQIHLF